MATESVRVYSFSFNGGSQTRPAISPSPARFLGLRHRPSSSLTSSSLSHFFGNVRISSHSSKLSNLRQQSRRNLSVFAMAAEGSFLLLFFVFLLFICRFLADLLLSELFCGFPNCSIFGYLVRSMCILVQPLFQMNRF